MLVSLSPARQEMLVLTITYQGIKGDSCLLVSPPSSPSSSSSDFRTKSWTPNIKLLGREYPDKIFIKICL